MVAPANTVRLAVAEFEKCWRRVMGRALPGESVPYQQTAPLQPIMPPPVWGRVFTLMSKKEYLMVVGAIMLLIG